MAFPPVSQKALKQGTVVVQPVCRFALVTLFVGAQVLKLLQGQLEPGPPRENARAHTQLPTHKQKKDRTHTRV